MLENGNVDDIHGLVNYSPLFDQFSEFIYLY